MDRPGEEQEKYLLVKDPNLPWAGPFPYDQLQRAGIDPFSSVRDVTNALFKLQGRASVEDRVAWDALRMPEQRLHADFFLYHLAIAEAEELDLPPPIEFPDSRNPSERTPEIQEESHADR